MAGLWCISVSGNRRVVFRFEDSEVIVPAGPPAGCRYGPRGSTGNEKMGFKPVPGSESRNRHLFR